SRSARACGRSTRRADSRSISRASCANGTNAMAASKPPVAWSSAALADLTETWERYARIAGRLSAEKTVREIAAACGARQERPFAGRARSEVSSGLRSLAVGMTVVFYRIGRDGSAEILRLLDRKRDVDEMIAGEGDRR